MARKYLPPISTYLVLAQASQETRTGKLSLCKFSLHALWTAGTLSGGKLGRMVL